MKGLIIYIHSPSVFILQYFLSYSFTSGFMLCGLCCIVNISVYKCLCLWRKKENCQFGTNFRTGIVIFMNPTYLTKLRYL